MKLTRRDALALLAAAPSALRALPSSGRLLRLYVGTYTEPNEFHHVFSKGLYTCTFDPDTGALSPFQLAAACPDPSFLAFSPRTRQLFTTNERGEGDGSITVFALASEASPKKLNIVPSGGEGPCHIALNRTGGALFAANYNSGTLSSFRVGPRGLSGPVSNIRLTAPGAAAHTHCVLPSPDNRFLLVNDLGLDRIFVFHLDAKTATLTPAATPFWSAAPGSGPRHSAFHPGGRWVYSLNETSSTLDHLEWKDGSLTHQGTVSTLPASAQGARNAPAELLIEPSGRFLYLTNRFHDSIAVFSLDPEQGSPKLLQDISSNGSSPRHLALDPSGRWLLVANSDGDGSITVLARDPQTGLLTATNRSYPLHAAACLLFT
ncbi:MAG TPA: lactonase family protein [Granulicella sp.]